jgi:hypothetical protein
MIFTYSMFPLHYKRSSVKMIEAKHADVGKFHCDVSPSNSIARVFINRHPKSTVATTVSILPGFFVLAICLVLNDLHF